MRRQRFSRVSPQPHSLCIFCACRFLGTEVQPILSSRKLPFLRRSINTTRSPRQHAAAAAVQAEPTNDSPPASQGSWDPNSTLTASERAEKERRQAAQRQVELERQRQLEARRAAEQERERAHQQRLDADERARHEELQRERARRREGEQAREQAHLTAMQERQRVEANEKLHRETSRNVFGGHRPAQQTGVIQRTLNKSNNFGTPAAKLSKPAFGASAEQGRLSLSFRGDEEGDIKPLQHRNDAVDERMRMQQSFEQEREAAKRRSNRPPEQENVVVNSPLADDSNTTRTQQQSTPNRSSYDSNSYHPSRTYRSAPSQQRQNGPQATQPEYRATLFDRNMFSAFESGPPPDRTRSQSDEWQHLKIKRPQSAPPMPPPPPPAAAAPQRRRSQENYSDDWIDRQFSQHQQQRRPPSQRSYQDNADIQTADPSTRGHPRTTPRAQQKCARCLEYGHSARECTGPVKSTCHLCGQVGHFSRECPQRATRGSVEPAYRRDLFAEPSPRGSPPMRQNDGNGGASQALFGSADRTVRTEVAPSPSQETIFQSESSSPAFERDQRDEERRARRSSRGFEDETASAEEVLDRKQPRRQSRRSMEVEDDEKADDAAASREERAARKASRKAAKKAEKTAERAERGNPVNLPDFVSVSNLAQTLNVRYEAFVERLQELGYDDIFAGRVLDRETSSMIAMEYNYDPIFEDASVEKTEDQERDLIARPEPAAEDKMFLETRPPVVTIMGHVDHGKTTILDYLRKSSVAAGEAGGITQHIGAFSVPLTASDKTITFLDTPGHAAFLAMRQRGANVTDIVILVVAADDSVKPQTLESLRCAREAGVPIIVAINKVDKPEADIQNVKQDLARNGIEIEDFGGDTQVVCVSGKTGEGMEELEEAISTLSEILDHRAETVGDVEGWVLEATTKKAGRVATVLVKRGTLKPGAVIVAGKTWARVRTLRNEAGVVVQEIGPGMPVEVDGWRDQPSAGDQVLQAESEQKAGDVVEFRIEKAGRERMVGDMEAINATRRAEQEKRLKERKAEEAAKRGANDATVDSTPSRAEEEETGQITVPFIIKADVSGSAEAVAAYIPSLTSPFIAPQILHSGVGPVYESDIELAFAAQGHIISFNLPPDAATKSSAEARGVKVLENNIIYRVLDDVREVLEEKLPPVVTQRVLGEAEIGATFDIKVPGGGSGKKVIWIAGCKVRNGVIGRGARARVTRGGEKVYDGTITSLKNVKKDVQEMRKGTECGMGFEGWEGFQVGDQVQTYEEISEKRRL